MKIAILSPGDSLNKFPGRNGYDILIGVNRGATFIECDWWSAMDILTCRNEVPIGNPNLFTINDTAQHLPVDKFAEVEILTHEELTIRPAIDWHIFSAPAALMLALNLGATMIDAWGCDMEGTIDCDGKNDIPSSRHPERWIRERAIWVKTTEFIRSYGITVVRKGI